MTDDSEPQQTDPAGEFEATFQATAPRPVDELLALLEKDYAALVGRLSAHLRSREAAIEALHDVYVKLMAGPTIGLVHSPTAYLYRMAVNVAMNRLRSDRRTVSADDAQLSNLPDTTPDQEAVAFASDEMDRALKALHNLPPRRQAIFLARWRDEKSQVEIAVEFGLHKRSVQKELARAETYLRKHLRRSKRPV